MPDKNATDFVFRVEGIKLSDQDQERISQAITTAVQTELLRALKPDSTAAIFRPIKWPGGIWIKGLNFDARLADLRKVTAKVNFGG
jgi:hypothetical protein